MYALLSSNEVIYDTLITDIYNYGRLIDVKFRLIRIAYYLLVLGLFSAVLVFFIA